MMSVSRRQDAVLSEGTPLPLPPLRHPLLCVSILHFTFFSLLFGTCTCLPQQFTSSFVSFPEVLKMLPGGKDSCTLLSSCALDQSVLAVPNIKHKIPSVKGLSRSQEIWKHKDLPCWEEEVSRTPSGSVFWLFGCPLTCEKGSFEQKGTNSSTCK